MYRERSEDKRWNFGVYGHLRLKKERLRSPRWKGQKVKIKIRFIETKERILIRK